MPKTPDKIKKGLNAPIPVHFHIGDPEPRLTPLALRDLEFLHTDALALVQQLEFQNAELLETVEMLKAEIEEYEESADKCCYESKCNAELNKLEALCKRLRDENEQLEAERDALMHWAKGRCDTCAHKDDCVKHDPDPEGYVMHWYDDCEIWEWRGVQKEK